MGGYVWSQVKTVGMGLQTVLGGKRILFLEEKYVRD